MIDAEGERTTDHSRQGIGAWARRGIFDADQRAEVEFEADSPIDEGSEPIEEAGISVPREGEIFTQLQPGADLPPPPDWLSRRPEPLEELEPGSFTDRGEEAERAAFLADGVYSGGEFAGGDFSEGTARTH